MTDLKKLLSQMTVKEKLGQLTQLNARVFIDTQADITGPLLNLKLTKEDLTTVGSVLNYWKPSEMVAIQRQHLKDDRNKIPMVFMMDVIHGYRTIFPLPLALGCSFNTDVVTECTKMAAREAVAGGVQVTFTPMVDYVRDARWGRVMESCGEDALLNSTMGAAQVKAFQGDDLRNKENIAACVKHFAAYGGADTGLDYSPVDISEHTLREHYLPAYKACIDAGVEMLMTSYTAVNGVPSNANEWLMKKILKDEWGFSGVVISDYSAVKDLVEHAITPSEKEAAEIAFNNGVDIEMVSTFYMSHIEELIAEGKISEEKLDEAVLRVLELKEKLGLFEDPYRGACETDDSEVWLTEENRDIARRAAEECAILLKNDGTLPFSKDVKKVALIGPFADTGDIIGFWACSGRPSESITVKEGLRRLLPGAEIIVEKGCGYEFNDTDKSGFAAAVEAAKGADAVILCLGEPQDYSGEGNSRVDISLHKIQLELAREIVAVNKNTAALTFSGRPLVLSELDETVPAILHMWFPGTEGGNAAANLLFGEVNPSGKVSMSFPRATGQCPIYYNRTKVIRQGPTGPHTKNVASFIECDMTPLYSFGHGLSYSSFKYESLELSSDKMGVDDKVTVKITVHNESDVPGKETVMLYMRDVFASNARPMQQLIAFKKLHFEAGERRTVEFTVDEPMLRFWGNDHKKISEAGEFEISTGYADHLIHTKSLWLEK
ncbi:MAG: glycoside hydrolase family 3 C-terminal domain-containing protein [Clostridia bacterium]|nr:glycoside hydrolase family 3 C-terminal domain-containing protein [Clostridia bacterium]